MLATSKKAKTSQPVEAEKPRVVKVKAFANEWALSLAKVYDMINAGELEVVRIGRSVRILAESAEEFARNLMAQ